MAIEIADFPIKNGGSFHCKMLVHQRVSILHKWSVFYGQSQISIRYFAPLRSMSPSTVSFKAPLRPKGSNASVEESDWGVSMNLVPNPSWMVDGKSMKILWKPPFGLVFQELFTAKKCPNVPVGFLQIFPPDGGLLGCPQGNFPYKNHPSNQPEHHRDLKPPVSSFLFASFHFFPQMSWHLQKHLGVFNTPPFQHGFSISIVAKIDRYATSSIYTVNHVSTVPNFSLLSFKSHL